MLHLNYFAYDSIRDKNQLSTTIRYVLQDLINIIFLITTNKICTSY